MVMIKYNSRTVKALFQPASNNADYARVPVLATDYNQWLFLLFTSSFKMGVANANNIFWMTVGYD